MCVTAPTVTKVSNTIKIAGDCVASEQIDIKIFRVDNGFDTLVFTQTGTAYMAGIQSLISGTLSNATYHVVTTSKVPGKDAQVYNNSVVIP